MTRRLPSLLFCTALLTTVARAQSLAPEDEAAAPREIIFRPRTTGSLDPFGAPLPPHGRLMARPDLTVTAAEGTFDARGAHAQLPDETHFVASGLRLSAEYGFADRWAGGARTELAYRWAENPVLTAGSFGLGDSSLFVRYVALEEAARAWPRVELVTSVGLPTGSTGGRAELLGTDVRGSGSWKSELGLKLTRGFEPILMHAIASWLHDYGRPTESGHFLPGEALRWAMAAEWPFWADHLALLLQATGLHRLPPRVGETVLAGGGTVEILGGAGLEVLFGPELCLLVGYERTAWGVNRVAVSSFTVTLVPLLL